MGTNADGTVSYVKFLERFQQRGGSPDRLKWMSGLHRFVRKVGKGVDASTHTKKLFQWPEKSILNISSLN